MTKTSASIDTDVYKDNLSSYALFLFLLAIYSLIILTALLFLPLSQEIQEMFIHFDTIVSLIFLADFFLRLYKTSNKTQYFFKRYGWLDLLSGIPLIRIFRIARIFRVIKTIKVLRKVTGRDLYKHVWKYRSKYIGMLTLFAIIVTVSFGSMFEYYFEAKDPGTNITTPGISAWWTLVTITTVGYGDYAPVTSEGRVVAIILMIIGIAVFGILTGLFANFFIGDQAVTPTPKEGAEKKQKTSDIEKELIDIKNELKKLSKKINSHVPRI